MTTYIVTRPTGQHSELTQQLAEKGKKNIHLPLLNCTITPCDFSSLFDYQIAIFVSPNAVTFAWQQMSDSERAHLQAMTLFSVGKKTAHCLQELGCLDVSTPRTAHSESLIPLIKNKHLEHSRLAIICGKGGRRTLEDSMKLSCAVVKRFECYNRAPITVTLNSLVDKVDYVWILTSEEAMRSLRQQTTSPLKAIVSSQRLLGIAQSLSFDIVATSRSAETKDIVKCIMQFEGSK